MKFFGFNSILVPRVSETTNWDHWYSVSEALSSTRVVDSRSVIEALGRGGGLVGKYPLFGTRTRVTTLGSGSGIAGTAHCACTRTGVDAHGSAGGLADTDTRPGPCTAVVAHMSGGEGAGDRIGTGAETNELLNGLSPTLIPAETHP